MTLTAISLAREHRVLKPIDTRLRHVIDTAAPLLDTAAFPLLVTAAPLLDTAAFPPLATPGAARAALPSRLDTMFGYCGKGLAARRRPARRAASDVSPLSLEPRAALRTISAAKTISAFKTISAAKTIRLSLEPRGASAPPPRPRPRPRPRPCLAR